MKKYLITILALVGGFQLLPAQVLDEYYPVGTSWTEEWYVEGSHTAFRHSEVVAGDSIIEGKVYKLVLREDSYGDINELYSEKDRNWQQQYYYCIREDSGKVYYYDSEDKCEVLWYDFNNWTAGQNVFAWHDYQNNEDVYRVADSIDTIVLLDGKEYEYLDYSWHYIPDKYAWNDVFRIRTIGNLGEGESIFENFGGTIWNGAWQYVHVVNFQRNGVIIYDHDKVMGYCLADVHAQQRDGKQSDGPIYDLQGRRLAGKPQRGLYIQNGKKYRAQ